MVLRRSVPKQRGCYATMAVRLTALRSQDLIPTGSKKGAPGLVVLRQISDSGNLLSRSSDLHR